jgi:sec-independent protein translocase protein TatA
MFGFGPTELIIILFIVLIIFGPKKLPEMGKAIGQSIRELRKAGSSEDDAAKDKQEKSE